MPFWTSNAIFWHFVFRVFFPVFIHPSVKLLHHKGKIVICTCWWHENLVTTFLFCLISSSKYFYAALFTNHFTNIRNFERFCLFLRNGTKFQKSEKTVTRLKSPEFTYELCTFFRFIVITYGVWKKNGKKTRFLWFSRKWYIFDQKWFHKWILEAMPFQKMYTFIGLFGLYLEI